MSEPRSKRQKIDKHGRFAALEKLKSLKGSKHKYDVSDNVDNVYDTVDDREYEKRVLARADDDWIEDDGTGYVEDGREIFDDEDENYVGDNDKNKSAKNRRSKTGGPGSCGGSNENNTTNNAKKRLRDINAPIKGKGSIKNLFDNASSSTSSNKKKTEKSADDNILSDILGDLDTEDDNGSTSVATKKSTTTNVTASMKLQQKKIDSQTEKSIISQYIQSVTVKRDQKPKQNDFDGDKLINKIQNEERQVNKNEQVKLSTKSLLDSPLIEKIKKINIVNESPPQLPSSSSSLPTNCDVIDHLNDNILDDLVIPDDKEFEEVAVQKELINDEPIKSSTNNNKPEEINKKIDDYETILSNWSHNFNDDNENNDDEQIFNQAIEIEELSTTTPSNDQPLNNNDTLKFWFYDAWEDPIKCRGQLFLFGKIKLNKPTGGRIEYKNVCIKIENVDRCMYILPREYMLDPITKRPTKQKCLFLDVYNDFNENVTTPLGINVFRSKKINRKFAFTVPGVQVPSDGEYLEVRYDGNKPPPNIKQKYQTFSHIFGTNTTSLERFLLDCKIKGPSWLTITNYTESKLSFSWSKLDITVPNIQSIQIAADEKQPSPPPLVLLTLNVRTVLNVKTLKNEVVMIACLVNKSYAIDKAAPTQQFQDHFCGFTRPTVQNWPLDLNLSQFKATKITKLESERTLLSWFLATFQRIDPDIIVLHDANDCSLNVLCDRISALKIPMWSRIGRLRMSQNAGFKRYRDYIIGRLICDIKHSAEELIKSRSFDLDTLCQLVLKLADGERNADCTTNEDIVAMYETSTGIFKLIVQTMQDCSYILRIMFDLNILPLAMQITTVCGNLMGRTLQAGRSERNEFLLLHAFVERGYIPPDRRERDYQNNSNNNNRMKLKDGGAGTAASTEDNYDNTINVAQVGTAGNSNKKKPQYTGGLVLEPQKGFYDKFILLMDFNSLYPSIIQEYNICFTTIDEIATTTPNETTEAGSVGGIVNTVQQLHQLPDSSVEAGVLPRQIKRLVDSRREVKKLMTDPDLHQDLKMQYNIRQMALKLTANSMYGCLGFTQSRFYAPHLAALVTEKGREILMNTKSLVEKLNFHVIYGDTDSIMINTNSTDYDQVMRIGQQIKQNVNKIYRQVELDIDGIFKYLLLLKKKKYASVIITKLKNGQFKFTQEHKGLDIVRRDWSQISAMAGKIVLDELLSDQQMEDRLDNIHNQMEKIAKSLMDETVPLSLLTITKQLTKEPTEYSAAMPHVQVAVRMNATRNSRYKKGDMVSYVICLDGTENTTSAMQRAYHLDEMKKMPNLKIDYLYYLTNQIHPVVTRLIEPIEGTDSSRIASCLGLDPSKFKASVDRQNQDKRDGVGESIIKSALQKYGHCNRFTFKCIACKTENVVATAFRRQQHQQSSSSTNNSSSLIPVLECCANSECTIAPYQYLPSIRNQLTLNVRKFIRQFYENWLVCNNPYCNTNTRFLPHSFLCKSGGLCMTCSTGTLIRQYSETDLYNQLSYFAYIFDLSKYEDAGNKLKPDVELAYATLKRMIDNLLAQSAYSVIKLSEIFSDKQCQVIGEL